MGEIADFGFSSFRGDSGVAPLGTASEISVFPTFEEPKTHFQKKFRSETFGENPQFWEMSEETIRSLKNTIIGSQNKKKPRKIAFLSICGSPPGFSDISTSKGPLGAKEFFFPIFEKKKIFSMK